MDIEAYFDPATWTISYLVIDTASQSCAVIDSVLDYDSKSGRTTTTSADKLITRIQMLGLTLDWILETHVHADHLSAAPYLKKILGGQIAIGAHITQVQAVFGELFNADDQFSRDGTQFDVLLQDNATFQIGGLRATAWHTPGHTPACMTFIVEDGSASHGTPRAAFVGDTLFMPDYGTARCDFPGGNARTLYRSIHRVLSLPPDTPLYMCHDYQPGGRDLQYCTTVADERTNNIHVRTGVSEDAFVAMRLQRDATLAMPMLLLPSVQINMRAGHFPPAEANGRSYIKIPLNAL